MREPDEFLLPTDSTDFVEQVYYRTEQLVRCGIWSGLNLTRIRRWRANFKNRLEDYFGACVLDALIYRSDAQTEALARHLWLSKLPRFLASDVGAPPDIEGAVADAFRHGTATPRVLVVPVIEAKQMAKSGHVMLRLLKQRLRLQATHVASVDQLPSLRGTSVVFIDDFLGSGSQFQRFARRYDLDRLSRRAFCVYAPLVAHDVGVTLLRRRYKRLRVVPCETLTAAHSLFSNKSAAFADGANSSVGARRYYRNLKLRRGIPSGWRLGESAHLSTAYVFQHAVPNNNIEILWTRQSSNWEPLFDR